MPETTQNAALAAAAPGQSGTRMTPVQAMDRAPLLQVASLSVRALGSRPHDILCPTDITLHSGNVLGLVGESGSGKTTLALALLGYARPRPPAGGRAGAWFPTSPRNRPPR
jgi:ABC-type multidrug transport system fused ATPase/permease subunit